MYELHIYIESINLHLIISTAKSVFRCAVKIAVGLIFCVFSSFCFSYCQPMSAPLAAPMAPTSGVLNPTSMAPTMSTTPSKVCIVEGFEGLSKVAGISCN